MISNCLPDTCHREWNNNSHAQQGLEFSATDGRYSSKISTGPFFAIAYNINVCADPDGRDIRILGYVLCLVMILYGNALLGTSTK